MDFVYEVKNNLPSSLCNEIIKRFEKDNRKMDGQVGTGLVNKDVRSSTVLSISTISEWKDIDSFLFENLKSGIEKYKQYLHKKIGKTALLLFENIEDEGYTIQKMKKNDFYDWHCDQGLIPGSPIRTVTCMWYLNTLNEGDGGSTEFMDGKSIRPEEGTLLFFPSGWSYVHRGEPVIKDVTKYTCLTWLRIVTPN